MKTRFHIKPKLFAAGDMKEHEVLAERLRDVVDRVVTARNTLLEAAIHGLMVRGVDLDRISRVEFDDQRTGLAVDGDGEDYPDEKVVFEVGTEGMLDGPQLHVYCRWLVDPDTLGSDP